MVFYSQTAKADLRNILWGLATWPVHPLGFDHATRYVKDLRAAADKIDLKFSHVIATNPVHMLFGDCVHTYRRNRHTQWHIIYNWEPSTTTAYVMRIINNFTSDSIAAAFDTGDEV